MGLVSCHTRGAWEAGCDEAGRGPLAGPVFAAAVVLPEDFSHPLLNDSKQLSERQRDLLRPVIEKEALAWAVCEVSAEEIDRINILNASIAGMWRAIAALGRAPESIIVDGNRFRPYRLTRAEDAAREDMKALESVPAACFVKGDGRYASIAAASVLAKTHRDERMRQLAAEYPGYGWERNMGYPTKDHIEAIRRMGYTPLHRRSFHVKELEEGTLF